MSQVIIHNKQLTVVSNLMLAATNRFLIEVRRDKSESTYKTYSAKIKIFTAFVNSFPMSNAPREDLLAFRSSLTEGKYSAASINLTLSVVRSFYKSLHERGVIDSDPTVVLKNVKTNDGLKKATFSKHQIEDILDRLSKDTRINATRDRALLALLFMNGLRIAEAANLKIEDFGMDNGKRVAYLLRKGHIDKTAFVILQEQTYQLLMNLIGDRTDGFVFVSYRSKCGITPGSLSRIVKTVFRNCGYDSPKLTAHSARHSYAHLSLTGGATLVGLMQSMNHKNVSTTMCYLRSFSRFDAPAEECVGVKL